jgi:hypothetical protein
MPEIADAVPTSEPWRHLVELTKETVRPGARGPVSLEDLL